MIAHEYFHNWSNRITCQDYSSCRLKKVGGVQDQCFTADLHSEAVKRIEDVSMLRNTQFREDAGPTARTVKPAEYQAIDNFYTTTIYEKGAELIRMLRTLLGPERFMKGMEVYVAFDGTAATTEDFVQAIADGATSDGQPLGFDLERFKRWYHQAGTPELSISRQWNSNWVSSQSTAMTPPHQDKDKQPLVLPVAMALVGEQGRVGEEQLLVMEAERASITLQGQPVTPPCPLGVAPLLGAGPRALEQPLEEVCSCWLR